MTAGLFVALPAALERIDLSHHAERFNALDAQVAELDLADERARADVAELTRKIDAMDSAAETAALVDQLVSGEPAEPQSGREEMAAQRQRLHAAIAEIDRRRGALRTEQGALTGAAMVEAAQGMAEVTAGLQGAMAAVMADALAIYGALRTIEPMLPVEGGTAFRTWVEQSEVAQRSRVAPVDHDLRLALDQLAARYPALRLPQPREQVEVLHYVNYPMLAARVLG